LLGIIAEVLQAKIYVTKTFWLAFILEMVHMISV